MSRAEVAVASRAEWRQWLADHHAGSPSIWLITGRKGHPGYLTNDDIVEEALCFGWIDSLPKKRDDRSTMLLLSPRAPGSSWSAINKARAARMIAAGLMMPAGQVAIDAARANGAWDRLDEVDALTVPADLAAGFAGYPGSAGNYRRFPPSARRGILEWLQAAKRPETRARRVAEIAGLAARNERALGRGRRAGGVVADAGEPG